MKKRTPDQWRRIIDKENETTWLSKLAKTKEEKDSMAIGFIKGCYFILKLLNQKP